MRVSFMKPTRKNTVCFVVLAGNAMTPSAITQSVPAIQAAANDSVASMLQSTGPVKMEDIANTFTLDVAWRQILGLDLKDDEVPVFRKAAKDWISGMMNPLLLVPFPKAILKRLKCYKAREYLVSKVQDKLQQFYYTGPDGSTLSEIYFATDKENDSQRKLTRNQVIDNALIPHCGGFRNVCEYLDYWPCFLLGLHPNVWQRVKEEQKAMIAKRGDEITKKTLDEDCPYLDASHSRNIAHSSDSVHGNSSNQKVFGSGWSTNPQELDGMAQCSSHARQ